MNLISSFFSGSVSRYPRPALDAKLYGKRVTLRAPKPGDFRNWRMLRAMSRDFLVPWEPLWPSNALSQTYFNGILRRQWRDWRAGRAYAFLIFRNGAPGNKGALAGGIALNDVQRGIAQKGTLGYWIGLPYARQGLMTEAVGLMCDFVFGPLRLHRVEASCLPHNEPSKKLLARAGFEQEGYAKSYLCINGQWQDHVLWGKAK